ncbi:MAG: signal peptidase II [Deltaproteobacteria bacterium]|nr:signal peptidase II [Deltaproteobacteria bacterium]
MSSGDSNPEPPPAPAEPAAPTAPAIQAKKPSYLFLTLLSVFVLAADLGSKWWAVKALEKDGFRLPAKELIKGRLSLVLARNPGGAWGMFHDQPEKVRKPFFVVVSVIAVIVIVGMYRKLDPKQHALRWGLPLVLGGAIGNLVDRVRYGQVIDFIDVVYWHNKAGLERHWPTFNVADIAICIGVGLMAIDFLFPHKRAVAPAKSARATGKVGGPVKPSEPSEPAKPSA